MEGWIKQHRKILDHPRFADGDWLKVWMFILLSATHAPIRRVFGSDVITLAPGQLITSRRSIATKTGVQESKVTRVLEVLKIEQQIEQASSPISTLITVCKWADYQNVEPPFEPPVNHDRTTGEPPVNTNKNRRTEEDVEIPARDVEPHSSFPKTEADAVTIGNMNAVPADFARHTYDKALSRGGCDAKGQPVRNFGAYLRTEWKYERQRMEKEKTNGSNQRSAWTGNDRNAGTANAGKASQYAGIGKV
jgi:hypothetical protein